METLEKIQNNLHNRILDLRGIERRTKHLSFITIFDKADYEDQQQVLVYIKDCNKYLIENWIRNQRQRIYNEMSLRELRQIGRKLCIPYYARLSKAILLSEISQYEEAKKSGVDGSRQVIV